MSLNFRILSENGIDVEKIEKKIKDAGINLNKICLKELPDEALEKIAGGGAGENKGFVCRCGKAGMVLRTPRLQSSGAVSGQICVDYCAIIQPGSFHSKENQIIPKRQFPVHSSTPAHCLQLLFFFKMNPEFLVP